MTRRSRTSSHLHGKYNAIFEHLSDDKFCDKDYLKNALFVRISLASTATVKHVVLGPSHVLVRSVSYSNKLRQNLESYFMIIVGKYNLCC